jgi:hypothetical protein
MFCHPLTNPRECSVIHSPTPENVLSSTHQPQRMFCHPLTNPRECSVTHSPTPENVLSSTHQPQRMFCHPLTNPRECSVIHSPTQLIIPESQPQDLKLRKEYQEQWPFNSMKLSLANVRSYVVVGVVVVVVVAACVCVRARVRVCKWGATVHQITFVKV